MGPAWGYRAETPRHAPRARLIWCPKSWGLVVSVISVKCGTSAYTEHQLADIEFGGTVTFLHKPFRAVDLTGAVRRTLSKPAVSQES